MKKHILAVLAYVLEEIPLSHRVLMDFRSDPAIDRLFEQGIRLRQTLEN